METIIDLVRSLTDGRAISSLLASIIRRSRSIGALLGTIFIFYALAIAFAARACYDLLPPSLPPYKADLIVSAGLLGLGLLASIGLYAVTRPRARHHSLARMTPETLAVSSLALAAPAVAKLKAKITARTPALAAISLCGGIVTGFMLMSRRR